MSNESTYHTAQVIIELDRAQDREFHADNHVTAGRLREVSPLASGAAIRAAMGVVNARPEDPFEGFEEMFQ